MSGHIPERPSGQPPEKTGLSAGAIVAIVVVAMILLVFGVCVAALSSLADYNPSGTGRSVAFGVVDGATVLASGGGEGVRLWDPATGTQIGKPLTGHKDVVDSVAFGVVDGRTMLASGAWDDKVRLWDPATGTQIGKPLTGHKDGVESVAFGVVDGRTVLASGGWDGTVRLWDPATGTRIGNH